MIYDIFKIKNDEVELNGKKSTLTDTDDLWFTYKSMHIAQAFNKLTSDFDAFQKSDLRKVGENNLDTFEDMENALSNMNAYKLKTSQFSLNIKLAEELNKRYKENHIYEILELEQDIVTGENEGKKINNRDIFKNFTMLKSKLQNQREDFIRL